MEIYAFGSIVRGEIDEFSDVDLLILKSQNEELVNIDKEKYSIYTYERVSQLWKEGNPFAWHLFNESKCVFSKNQISFIETLGRPANYNNMRIDLDKFHKLFQDSSRSIISDNYTVDFDLSMIFLSIRNFSSCFALGYLKKFEFSRDSALKIGKFSININEKNYDSLKKSRLLATRGLGKKTSKSCLDEIIKEFPVIEQWFDKLLTLIK